MKKDTHRNGIRCKMLGRNADSTGATLTVIEERSDELEKGLIDGDASAQRTAGDAAALEAAEKQEAANAQQEQTNGAAANQKHRRKMKQRLP